MKPICPTCRQPGGVMLFTSIAPCDRCAAPTRSLSRTVSVVIGGTPLSAFGAPVRPPTPPGAWDGTSWPPSVGALVRRGAGWRWGDQDCDYGFTQRLPGAILGVEPPTAVYPGWLKVQWQHGGIYYYYEARDIQPAHWPAVP